MQIVNVDIQYLSPPPAIKYCKKCGKKTEYVCSVKIGCKIPNISGLKFPRKSRHTLREESKYGEKWGVFCDQRNA
ncbi:hypothetical protein ACLL8W_25715, partial [Brevibacillus borstelensis]